MAENAMPKDNEKSASSKKGLYIGLAAGGVLLLSCCVCGTGGGIGYVIWSRSNPLVGKWEAADKIPGNDVKRELEFHSGGTGARKVTIFKGLAGGKDSVIFADFRYTFTRGEPSILETETIRPDGSRHKERFEVTFAGDTMTVASPEFRAKPGGSLTYRRRP